MRRLSLLLLVLIASAPASMAHAAVPRPAPRILNGGSPASPHPWMAALVVRNVGTDAQGQTCGGTVIAPLAVLTAAHCITEQPPGQGTPAALMVVTGKDDLSQPGGEHLAIRSIVTQPNFDPMTFDHDVAVLLLATSTSATPVTRRSTAPPSSGTATAFGWGAIDPTTPPPAVAPSLMQAPLTIQAAGSCPSATAICAGNASNNICVGDSGGPLMFGSEQIGIVSSFLPTTSSTCSMSSSSFADVFAERTFIDQQLAPSVANVTIAAVSPTMLRVSWQAAPGGETPTVTVTTSNAPGTPRPVAAGAASLDIGGLPTATPIGATVTVANTWGAAQAQSTGTATLTGIPVLPAITKAAVTTVAIGAQVVANGAPVTVTGQYGLDTVHLITTPALHLPDKAVAQMVSIPLAGLLPARTYHVRLVARSAVGTTASPWLSLVTPAVKPAVRTLPKVRGTAKVGRTLTCTSGAWSGAPAPRLSYRWRIGSRVSSRFRTSRLKLTTAMRGTKVACVVTGRNAAGSVTARSAAVTVRRR